MTIKTTPNIHYFLYKKLPDVLGKLGLINSGGGGGKNTLKHNKTHKPERVGTTLLLASAIIFLSLLGHHFSYDKQVLTSFLAIKTDFFTGLSTCMIKA